MPRRPAALLLATLLALAVAPDAGAQLRPRHDAAYHPAFDTEFVSPAVHKWYGMRHLAETYIDPWYSAGAGRGREAYSRYIDRALEGRELYDTLGAPLGRGWVVYNWTQTQPQPRGSSIDKKRGFSGNASNAGSLGFTAYDSFFQRLVVAGDYGGASSYRLAVGDEI